MSIMSVKIVKNPRGKYNCGDCHKPLNGIHLCAFHGSTYGKPFIVRLCIPCAKEDVEYSCYEVLKQAVDNQEFIKIIKKEIKAIIGDEVEVELYDGTLFTGKFDIHALAGICVLNKNNFPISFKKINRNISDEIS